MLDATVRCCGLALKKAEGLKYLAFRTASFTFRPLHLQYFAVLLSFLGLNYNELLKLLRKYLWRASYAYRDFRI
jgi:hypothetical protein